MTPPDAGLSFTAEAVEQALNEKGLASHLTELSRDQDRRSTRMVRPLVLDIGAADKLHGFPPPGSVLLMFATRGSGELAEFESAFLARDRERLAALQDQVQRSLQDRPLLSMSDAVGKLIDSPVHFDFRYSGKPLAAGLGLINGIQLGAILFPTNGGRILAEQLTVLEYCDPPDAPGYDYLVIHREASLTDLEQQVLASVPPDQTEINISSGASVMVFPAVIGYVVVATLVGTACVAPSDALDRVHLSEEQVRRLGAHASARELLRLRREVHERSQRA